MIAFGNVRLSDEEEKLVHSALLLKFYDLRKCPAEQSKVNKLLEKAKEASKIPSDLRGKC